MPAESRHRASDASGQVRKVVELEERTWLARHCRGDRDAFQALLAAYRRPIYSYLVRTGIAEADRDDIFQNIFLKVHRAARTYQPSRPLRPWLFTIAANTVRTHFRDRRGAGPLSTAGVSDEPVDPNPGPERIVAGRETVAWLEGAIAALPPAQRQVLVLVSVVGLRQRDVAEALALPLNTVKTHLRRARLGLAEAMAGREAPDEPTGGRDAHL